MTNLLYVGLGGALGAIARYGIGLAMVRLFGAGFPWGTLLVNVAGGFAMGVVFTFYGDKRALTLLLATGVLGGFTTFSAFSLETVRMMERGAFAMAAGYVLASVVASCAALMIGLGVARSVQ